MTKVKRLLRLYGPWKHPRADYHVRMSVYQLFGGRSWSVLIARQVQLVEPPKRGPK